MRSPTESATVYVGSSPTAWPSCKLYRFSRCCWTYVDLLHHPHYNIAAHNSSWRTRYQHCGVPPTDTQRTGSTGVQCSMSCLTVVLLLPSKMSLNIGSCPTRPSDDTGSTTKRPPAGDETALAIACGDVDGRRDNRRVFSREEEQLLRERLDEENIDPNKSVIQRLALAIHHQQHLSSTPAKSTRSRALPTASFSAGSSFVERVKHDLHLSSQKPEIEKRYKRKKTQEDDR